MRTTLIIAFLPIALLTACVDGSGIIGGPDSEVDPGNPFEEENSGLRQSDDPDAQFRLSDPRISAFEDDGFWSPGEVLNITLLFTNTWDEEHMWYPGVHAEIDDTRVEIDSVDYWLYGMVGLQSIEAGFNIEPTEDIPFGDEILFTFSATSLACDREQDERCPAPNPLDLLLTVGN